METNSNSVYLYTSDGKFALNYDTREYADLVHNRTKISWGIILWDYQTRYTSAKVKNVKLYINDELIYSTDSWKEYTLTNGDALVNFNTSNFYIDHNADGYASYDVVFSAEINGENVSTTKTVIVHRIIRTPTVVSTPDLVCGTQISLTVIRQDPGFLHTISYTIGNVQEVICNNSNETSINWTPPENMANGFPNSLTGEGFFTVITTIAETGEYIGESITPFTVSVNDSMQPYISSFTADYVNNSVPSSWHLYIQNVSQCRLTTYAFGSYGSTIEQYVVKEGTTVIGTESDVTTKILKKTGTINYSVEIRDSRGRTASASVSINVVEYEPPSILSISSGRYDASGNKSDEGLILKSSCSFSYYPISGKNSVTAKLQYRRSGVPTWTNVSTSYTSGSLVTIINNASIDDAYEVRYTITDKVTSTVYIDIISTGYTTMDFLKGGKGIGIGKVAEDIGVLDIDMFLKIRKGYSPNILTSGDLNLLTVPNIFGLSGLENFNHYPINVSDDTITATLEILPCGVNGEIIQRITTLSFEVFIRSFVNNAWSNWTKKG